jgi:hypothetical protein
VLCRPPVIVENMQRTAEVARPEKSRVKYLELAQAWLSEAIYFPVTPKRDSS